MSYQQQQSTPQITNYGSSVSVSNNNQQQSNHGAVSVHQGQHNNNFCTAAIQQYIFPRNPPNTNSNGGGGEQPPQTNLYSILNTVTGKADLSPTFWVPDISRGEYSLLSALIKRQSQHLAPDDYLPLVMRPDLELANNFSTFRNERIDLSGDKFKLSKVTQTLSNLTRSTNDPMSPVGTSGNVNSPMMSLNDVKEGLRSGLSAMQTDEYFLVKYRDYSEFATARWSEEAQRERFLSPKYVEKYFAVRVGSHHGVFIPITENQFVRGTEILTTANMSPESVAKEKFFVSLSSDQFKALGAPSTEYNAKETNNNNNNNGNNQNIEDPDLDLPPPPHPLDFSAEAFNIRWKRFARRQYHYFGRIAIRVVVVGAAAYFIRYYYFPPSNQQMIEENYSSRRNNNNRRRSNSSQVIKDVVSLPVTLLGAMIGSAGRGGRMNDEYDD